MFQLLDRVVAGVLAAVRIVCIALATVLFVIVVVAVVARYVFGQAVSWTEEVPRYLLIWVSFLGAAACVAKREHVGFDIIFNALPRRIRRVLGAAIGLLIFGFGWIVLRYGIVFVREFGSDLMETIPFKNYWYYVAMPVSGALLMLFALKTVVDSLRGQDDSQIGQSVD
ncbi:MAG TPA: TRAP transporter small permease [Methylomirabilota bacterium]